MPPEVIGVVPEGIRANFHLAGGSVDGPRLKAKVLPVGADFLLLRKAGICILDVRSTWETGDGALIYVAYSGIAEAGPDGYEKFLADAFPTKLPLRNVPRFLTSHPDYAWLNRVQCYGVGEADLAASRVSYDVYAAP